MTTENIIEKAPLIDPEAVGAEVSWSFGDGAGNAVELPRSDVKALFGEHGWSSYIYDVDEDDALRRAARYARESKTIAVRPLAQPTKTTSSNKPPVVFGVYHRQTQVGESGDKWLCHAIVKFVAGTAYCLPPEGATFGTSAEAKACEAVGNEMERRANSVLSNVQNLDLSNALTEIGRSLYWASRRRIQGGVYLITKGRNAESFVALLQGLAALSRSVHPGEPHRYFYPQIQEVYAKPLTMASWKDSAKADIEADISKLLGDLDAMRQDGKMRDKTRFARADECDALISKADHLKAFLGDALGQLTESLTEIREGFRTGTVDKANKVEEALSALDAMADATAQEPAQEAPKSEPAPEAPKTEPAPKSALSARDEELFDLGI